MLVGPGDRVCSVYPGGSGRMHHTLVGAHRVQVCTQWWCSKLLHANACMYLFTQLKTNINRGLTIIKTAIMYLLIVLFNHVKIINKI